MAVDKVMRAKIEAELALGVPPRELADHPEYKKHASYPTINNWKNEMDKRKGASADIDVLVKTDPSILHMLAAKAKALAPEEVADKIEVTVEKIEGLQLLEGNFQATMITIVERADKYLKDEKLSIRDWEILTKALSTAYAAIYNKSGVNVNVVQQQNISSEKLTLFKGNQKS